MAPTEKVKHLGLILSRLGKLIAFALLISAFLGWYDGVRNNGRLFLCDIASFFDKTGRFAVCREEEALPDQSDLLERLEYLKAREGQLSPERIELLHRLEKHFEDRAVAVLTRATGLEEAPLDSQSEADKREAARQTVEEGSPEERRALAMIAEGDVKGGLQLLSELASAVSHKNAAQWRRIGRLAFSIDTARALSAYEKVLALDQSNPWDAIYLGRLYQRAGALAKAHRTYTDALARLPESEARDHSVLMDEFGDVLVGQGNLEKAMASYQASMAIRKRLAEADPDNAGWQRDLAVSHIKIGNVLVDQGNLEKAMASYRASHAIFKPLAAADPDNDHWQRDLAVSHEKIGNALVDQRNLVKAMASYRASMAISKRLAEAEPDNAGWQRNLAVSHEKIGNVLIARRHFAGALASYRASHAIFKRLAAADPDNTGWQRDLSASHIKIGNALVAQGRLAEALASYRASMAIRKRLAEADPGNTGWQRSLSVSHEKIAMWKKLVAI